MKILGKLFFVIALLSFALPMSVGASVNDFTIKDFDIEYYLSRDSNGRSSLTTKERITAVFPSFDQNHGIERALVATYDGHSTNLRVQSVTDRNGSSLEYTTRWSEDNLVLRIGDADKYVHGENVYVITYTQNDVTKYFENTKSDEFYWDTNGTGWSQIVENLSVRVFVEDDLLAQTNGKTACYYGYNNANDMCQISRFSNGYKASISNLGPYQNMTIAIGFDAETFQPYVMDLAGFVNKYMVIMSSIVSGVGLMVVAFVRWRKGKNAPGRGIIVPEYLPPKEIDTLQASIILRSGKTWMASMLIDLAVRHNIKLIEIGKKKYKIEFISDNKLSKYEKEVIKAFFGSHPVAGEGYELKRFSDVSMSRKLSAIVMEANKTMKKGKYYLNKKHLKRDLGITVGILTANAFLATNLAHPGITLYIDMGYAVAMFVGFLGIILITSIQPLSSKGMEKLEYLKGLKQYITIAEEDRLNVLQSPKGASEQVVDISDKGKVLKIYERVLPYAVLFGKSKDWLNALGKYYETSGTTPDWYAGNTAFNAALFSSSISNFSSGIGNSYTASSSSSTGGSGGGGFSGGGGGGGGGGGW